MYEIILTFAPKLKAKVLKMWQFIKKYVRRYPLSVVFIFIVWVLSLMPFFPETGLEGVPFIDKWTHFLMYGSTCTVIWWEYVRQHQKYDAKRLFTWAWLMPIIMSGILELLQEYATTTRRGEWLDFMANSTGVTIGAAIGILLVVCYPRS